MKYITPQFAAFLATLVLAGTVAAILLGAFA